VASRWALLGREAHAFKVCLSSSLRMSSAIGRGLVGLLCGGSTRRLAGAQGFIEGIPGAGR
jgi:hypothetical protein